MPKHIIDIEVSIKNTINNYKNNKNKTKIYYDNKVEIDYEDFKDIDFKIIHNNTLLSSPHLAKNLISKDIANMIKFDIMWSSLSANPAATITD